MVDENMSNAARTHAIEWGKGLGGRTVIAFGGSAPIHAARLADKLELDRFLVPGDAGVGSAVGFLLAPISYEVVRSRYMRLLRFDPGLVREVLAGMRAEAVGVVGEGAPGVATTERAHAYMRYVGQGHEIGVELPLEVVGVEGGLRSEGSSEVDSEANSEEAVAALRAAFDRAYRTVYGRTIPGLDVEVLSWTLVVSAPARAVEDSGASAVDPGEPGGSAPDSDDDPAAPGDPAAALAGGPDEPGEPREPATAHPAAPQAPRPPPTAWTQLFEGTEEGFVRAAVHHRHDLDAGDHVSGPALIAEDQTTTVVPNGWEATVLPGGHLLAERRARATARAGVSALQDQIMWSRLLSVVEEQARTLVRTAFSTPVREAGDLSAGVFDLSGRMLAQAVTGTPGHVNAMAASVGFSSATTPWRPWWRGTSSLPTTRGRAPVT